MCVCVCVYVCVCVCVQSMNYYFVIRDHLYMQGLSQRVHKKLRFIPTVIYIDGEFWGGGGVEENLTPEYNPLLVHMYLQKVQCWI